MIPPSLELSEKHAKANNVGFPVMGSNLLHCEKCPCCDKPLMAKEVPLCVPYRHLSFLGPAYPLYF